MSKYSRSYFPPHHFFIQNKLILAINDPSFQLVLPELRQSTWNRVLLSGPSADDERERLEFVGDALMHASVALELYKLYPRGTPHLYTVLRAALNTNCTFTQYMLKIGAFEKRPRHQPKASADAFDKIAADAFETLIAAYYFEQGFQAVCTWVSVTLKPLIIVARKAYDEFLAGIRPTQKLDKGLRAEMDIYLAGKKTRLSIQPEPSHSLGSIPAQVVTRDEGTPSFSASQVAEHCQAVVNNTDGRLPADYHTDREILGSLKSPTEAKNLGSEMRAAAASPMHDYRGRPPSGPKRDDFGINLIADGAETNEWTDMDVQSDVACNGSVHPNGPASDRRSLLTPPSSLDASQLRHASSSVSSSAFKRPGTRRSRRILRALQQLHKTTDLDVLLTDTAGIVKISQVSAVDKGHVLSSPVASSFSGPGKSNISGSASGVFSLQSLTWKLLSTHSLPKYSITEKLRKVSMKDFPTANSRRLRRQRRKAGLRASRDTGLGILGASTSCANDDVLNVVMPISILPHSGAKETALGASDNPITVDCDDDVEMTHA